MAQIKTYDVTVENIITGRQHVHTGIEAASKRAAAEKLYVRLATSIYDGDTTRAKCMFRITVKLTGYLSCAAIDTKHAAGLNAEAKTRAARRKRDRAAAAARRAAKAAKVEMVA